MLVGLSLSFWQQRACQGQLLSRQTCLVYWVDVTPCEAALGGSGGPGRQSSAPSAAPASCSPLAALPATCAASRHVNGHLASPRSRCSTTTGRRHLMKQTLHCIYKKMNAECMAPKILHLMLAGTCARADMECRRVLRSTSPSSESAHFSCANCWPAPHQPPNPSSMWKLHV